MKTEVIVLNQERNVTLTAYTQDVEEGSRCVRRSPAILVLPGGGYQSCSDREADPVAFPYLQAGYQVFVLRYSVKEYAVWPNPLEDYEQAMSLIRRNAEKWQLYPDKVAVIGFSAGGHLAAAAATMSVNRPDAAILGYAVTSLDVKGCNMTAPDTISQVDKDTCPCFLFTTRTDEVVPVMNTIRFMEALAKAGTAFESHIYSYGPHGFSTADPFIQSRNASMSARVPDWVQDSIGWLKEVFGDFGEGEMTKPVVKTHLTADWEPFLSVDCTLRKVMDNPDGKRIVEEVLKSLEEQAEGKGKIFSETISGMTDPFFDMKIRRILDHLSVPADMTEEINSRLSEIPND